MGWANLRDDEKTYAVDVKDLTVSNPFTAAHVVALAKNPFEEGHVPPSLELVVNNRDNTQPGEAIPVTRITALAGQRQEKQVTS